MTFSNCPLAKIAVDPITVKWDLNAKKQPGPINLKSITLGYNAGVATSPAVLSCADAPPRNASCSSLHGEGRWCSWMLSTEKDRCNVTGLMAYTLYIFQLTAGNPKGNDSKRVQKQTCLDREFICYWFAITRWTNASDVGPTSSKILACQVRSNSNGSFSTLLWTIGRTNAPDVNYTLIWNDDDLHNSSVLMLDRSLKPYNRQDPITCRSSNNVANCTIHTVTKGHSYRYRIISTTEVGNASSEETSCDMGSSAIQSDGKSIGTYCVTLH